MCIRYRARSFDACWWSDSWINGGWQMKLGIIYAGQGSQVVGMGKSFYPREIFDQNEDLKELCFNGPLEKLSYTCLLYTSRYWLLIAVK